MEELTRLRAERGWSQQKLADESGVNKATINQIERGRRSPNVETLEKLAAALGAGVADFFPKAQAPLPLDFADSGARATYTAYEALGRVLAHGWREDLAEWDEKLPPGEKELDESDQFLGLLTWVSDMSQTTSFFVAVAREAGFRDRPEFHEVLAEMDAAKAAGLAKLRRTFQRIKTEADFHCIIKENELLQELQLDG